jgi:hypothetical protein
LPRSNGSVRFQKSRSTGLSRWQSANYGSLGDTRITATVNDTLLTAVTTGNRTAANFANNSGPRLESQHAPDSNSAHFSCARYPCRATACQLQAVEIGVADTLCFSKPECFSKPDTSWFQAQLGHLMKAADRAVFGGRQSAVRGSESSVPPSWSAWASPTRPPGCSRPRSPADVVRLLPDWSVPSPIHLVSPQERRHSAKVRAFAEYVAQSFAAA